jgi:transcriptional regulator with XRE-family HTH domain
MSDLLPSIEIELSKKLQDRTYRQVYFLAESSAFIAKQLIELRKRRGLNQTQVAQELGTGQPAISRVERADYRNWSFNTLRRLAEVLDARIRVYIEPSEDVLGEYSVEIEENTGYGSAASERTERQAQKPEQAPWLGSLTGSAATVRQTAPLKVANESGLKREQHGIS